MHLVALTSLASADFGTFTEMDCMHVTDYGIKDCDNLETPITVATVSHGANYEKLKHCVCGLRIISNIC